MNRTKVENAAKWRSWRRKEALDEYLGRKTQKEKSSVALGLNWHSRPTRHGANQ